jgi:hypothetical protein
MKTIEVYMSKMYTSANMNPYMGVLLDDGKVIGTSPKYFKTIEELLGINIQDYEGGVMVFSHCELICVYTQDKNPEYFL